MMVFLLLIFNSREKSFSGFLGSNCYPIQSKKTFLVFSLSATDDLSIITRYRLSI